METEPDFKKIGIGTKATPKLEAKKCIVQSVDIEQVGEGKKAGNKAIFYLKHPDKPEPLKVSTAVIMKNRKGDKREIVSYGTWFNLDSEGKLNMESVTAEVLRYYNAENLEAMIQKEVSTEVSSAGYLAIKAY